MKAISQKVINSLSLLLYLGVRFDLRVNIKEIAKCSENFLNLLLSSTSSTTCSHHLRVCLGRSNLSTSWSHWSRHTQHRPRCTTWTTIGRWSHWRNIVGNRWSSHHRWSRSRSLIHGWSLSPWRHLTHWGCIDCWRWHLIRHWWRYHSCPSHWRWRIVQRLLACRSPLIWHRSL